MLRMCAVALALTPLAWGLLRLFDHLAEPSGGAYYAANMLAVGILVLIVLHLDPRLNRP